MTFFVLDLSVLLKANMSIHIIGIINNNNLTFFRKKMQ